MAADITAHPPAAVNTCKQNALAGGGGKGKGKGRGSGKDSGKRKPPSPPVCKPEDAAQLREYRQKAKDEYGVPEMLLPDYYPVAPACGRKRKVPEDGYQG